MLVSEPMRTAVISPVIASIEDLDKHEWDPLVSESDFFHCHGWLAGLDYAFGKGKVLALYSGSSLLGGCALWEGENAPGLFYLPDYFPKLPDLWQQGFLWGGARRSTHNEIPCVCDLRRGDTLAAMAENLALQATAQGKVATVIPYMPLRQAVEVAEYYDYARVLLHSAEATIAVTAGGLNAHLEQLSPQRRRRINAELSAFYRKGNQLEWSRLEEPLLEPLAQLIANNREKYGSHQGISWMRRIFDGQRRSSVLDSAVVAMAKRNQKIRGATVFYPFCQAFHARYYGADYQIDDNDFCYFALTYYHSLDYAAERGLTQCRFSISALKAKILRGAQLEPLVALLLFGRKPRLSLQDCVTHNYHLHQFYQQYYRKQLTADWNLLNEERLTCCI